MAGVPNRFEPGTIASSSEMNENFDFIENILGDSSSSGILSPKGPINIGPRGQVSGQDLTYVQLGWNVDQVFTGSNKNLRRFVADRPATAIRLGEAGFGVFMTSQRSGSLNAQLREVFGVYEDPDNKYVYIDPNFEIRQNKRRPAKVEDRRLTYIAFSNPKTVYENKEKRGGEDSIDVFSHGVPKNAVAVEMMVYATATFKSGAAVKLMQGAEKPHQKTGFICHAYGGSAAGYGRSAAQGRVLIGVGSFKGRVVEHRTEAFTTCSIYIQGYYI